MLAAYDVASAAGDQPAMDAIYGGDSSDGKVKISDHVSLGNVAMSQALDKGGIKGDDKMKILQKEIVQSARRDEDAKNYPQNKTALNAMAVMMRMSAERGNISICKRCKERVLFGGRCCGE